LRVGFSSITHPSLLRFGAAHSRIYRFPKTFSQITASSPTFLIESKARIRYSHLHRGIMSRCFTLVAYIMFSKVRLHPKTMSHVATQILRRRSPRANYSSSTPAMLRNFEEREILCVCVCEALYRVFTHWYIMTCFYIKDWDEFFFIKYWKINHWEQVDLNYMIIKTNFSENAQCDNKIF